MNRQLVRQKLPDEAQQGLDEGAKWLLTARFEQLEKENYFYCVEAKALVDHFSKVLAHFNDEVPYLLGVGTQLLD